MKNREDFFVRCEGFLKRKQDLKVYAHFLTQCEEDTIFSANKNRAIRLLHIHRAQAYILAYNLMEYVFEALSLCLENYLQHPDLKFETLSKKTKDWVFSLYQERVVLKGGDISREHLENLIKAGWDVGERLPKYPKFSGNWNWEKAHKYFKNFGWAIDETTEEKWWREPITKVIWEERNQLGHGEEAYSTIGASTTAYDIQELFKKTQDYLLKMVRSIIEFLKNNTL